MTRVPPRGLPWRLDRARYQLRQRSLAALAAPGAALFHLLLNPVYPPPSVWATLTLQRRYSELLARDLENVERGYYPRDLLFDLPLRDYLGRAREGLPDIPRIVLRRLAGNHGELPEGADPERYPKYYLRTFHWQTDGWLSDHSARLYDPGVEFLFLGTADVMRRMAIPPVVDAVEGAKAPSVLDVACGTGRFLHQLRRALPGARLSGLDMSPFYVDYAREALRGAGVRLRAGNAEAIPWRERSLDAVTSIYLFHELPKPVRRKVVREARRVLKPGGRFVVLDSAQVSDSPALAEVLRAFPAFYHEPFYDGYLRDDLESLMEECGFEVVESRPWFVSKLVVGERA